MMPLTPSQAAVITAATAAYATMSPKQQNEILHLCRRLRVLVFCRRIKEIRRIQNGLALHQALRN